MAHATVHAGVCGFTTTIHTLQQSDGSVTVAIESDCHAIQRLGQALTTVDPFREFTFRGKGPEALDAGRKYCNHPACVIPSAIIKAVEVEAGLALPADVAIQLTKE